MITPNFRQWRDAGYVELLPVIPPNAQVASTKRFAMAGKSPGKRHADGKWSGLLGWNKIIATDADLSSWQNMGASVGLRRGAVFMLDIDIYDETTANMVEARATELFGEAPLRVGQWPKRGLLYRGEGLVKQHSLQLDLPGGNNLIEIPPQAVIEGVHAKTGKPYEWRRKPVPFADLPIVTPEQLASFMDEMRATLPVSHGSSGTTADREKVDQNALKATDFDVLRSAVEAIPNVHAKTGYDWWVRLAYALRGACQDDYELGLELFEDFSARTDLPQMEEDPSAIYRRTPAPFALGADYIYAQAEKHGWDGRAKLYFEELPDEVESPFAQAEAKEAQQHAADLYPLLRIDELINRPPPSFLIDRHIPDVSVGFLYSAPGAGKSFLAIDMALAIAHGDADWNGDAIKAKPDARSLYIASEGSFDLGNRVKASHKAKGRDAFTDRFLVIEQTIQFMKTEDIDKLLRTVRAAGVKPALVVVDTVSRAMPGADENLQKDMTLFVAACDRVRDEFQCAVLGVHHAGKSGDMRGSTVLLGAGDFVFKLERKKGASIGTLTCEKQKAAEDGWAEPYRFDRVDLGAGQSSLVPVRETVGFGPDAELTPQVTERVLAAMDAAWEAGSPWAKAAQSGDRRALYHMVQDFGFKGADAEDVLSLWEKTGLIVVAVRDAKSKVKGYQVVGGAGQAVLSEGIFD